MIAELNKQNIIKYCEEYSNKDSSVLIELIKYTFKNNQEEFIPLLTLDCLGQARMKLHRLFIPEFDKIVISPSYAGKIIEFDFSFSKLFSGDTISTLKSSLIYAAASLAIFSALAIASSIVPTI